MGSRQEKEERAEAEALQAAYDLRDANRQREYEERAKEMAEHYHPRQQEERPGLMGSVLKRVSDTYEHAKEAVVGKSQDTTATAADTAAEYKDYTAHKAEETKGKLGKSKDRAADKTMERTEAAKEKAGDYKDYVGNKAAETKDKIGEYKDCASERTAETTEAAKGKAGEYKDYVADKATETKDKATEKAKEANDYTAENAEEGREGAASKIGGLAESAKDAARKAVDIFTTKKEEAEETAVDTKEATKGKLSEAEEEARQKMEEMKLEGKEYKEHRDNDAQRGTTGGDTVSGNLGLRGITDTLKKKFTQPHESAGETETGRGRKGEEVVVVDE